MMIMMMIYMYRVRNEEKVRGMSYIEYKDGQLTGFGHIAHSNCPLKHVIQGKIEVG